MSNPAAEQMDEPESVSALQDIDPTEGDVRAVPAGETPYTSASAFEDLPLSPALPRSMTAFEPLTTLAAVTLRSDMVVSRFDGENGYAWDES